MRILIVDDDFLVRSNLKRLIETSPLCRQQGFSVACEATDGEQAMQMIPSARPDLVISDIRMPQMDGLELQEALKCAYPDILLVMLSGYDELDYVRQALKNEARAECTGFGADTAHRAGADTKAAHAGG